MSKRYGLSPDTIWLHSGNALLRKIRTDPHVLLKGDQVFIPEKAACGELAVPTGQTHKFVLSTRSTMLRLRVVDDQEPLCDTQYTLEIDGTSFRGFTNADGVLQHAIPCDATRGVLQLENLDSIKLELGALDPLDTVTGLQQRLTNLGYPCGSIDGIYGDRTKAAVIAWQQGHGLPADGIVGTSTREILRNKYGC